jgi:ATP-dependent Lhr-like helicase
VTKFATKMPTALQWLRSRGWKPFAFQREVWRAIADGASGLLHANTGTGKTLAVWLGALQALPEAPGGARTAPPLTVLWITPMRALAADTLRALREPMSVLAPHWTSGLRSGDTTSAERATQDRRLLTVLVTTPESLTLLLSRADALATMGPLRLVVVDEWHEMLGNKRGVQVQLALARLRRNTPGLMSWALSATLGNLEEAMRTLVGVDADATAQPAPRLVRGEID